ncbi:MAG TPA: xanthine dehydrogenase family protein molybdopterin-binding subunit [bacterium]
MSPAITRREFLQLTGSGLTIVVLSGPLGLRLASAEEAGNAAADFQPNVWLRVAPSGDVTIVVNKSEMGQGVLTSLAMVVADELEADWKRVRVLEAPAGDAYIDPVWHTQGTGGSSSVRHMYQPLREAGAAAREMLVAAAAASWGVPAGECAAALGTVTHAASGRSAGYGELVAKAAGMPVPAKPALKDPAKFRYIGTAVPRTDTAAKVEGAAGFGIDSFAPGMLYGVFARPPAFGAKAAGFDRAAAALVPGVVGVHETDRGVAVVAETLEAAWKGRDALAVSWSGAADPELDTGALQRTFAASLERSGVIARSDGDAAKTLSAAAKTVAADYHLPYLAHVTMEPMNCTAAVKDGRCDVWAPTQNQTGVRALAAKITGLPAEQVSVHTTFLGGGFGRRFETDFVAEALTLAVKSGRPVKVIWRREEDIRYDFYRPANSCRLRAALDAGGRLTALHQKVAVPSIFARVFPDQVKNGIDPAAMDGLEDMDYEIPNLTLEYVRVDTPVPVGFWRSVGASHNGFTLESFMDEAAAAAGKDPLDFRLALLGNHPQTRRVLETAAGKAGWGKPLPAGTGRGIAFFTSFGSRVAQVAEVAADLKTGQVRAQRVVCAVDSGIVVNPDTLVAQMMGGIVMGLSAALLEAVDFRRGGTGSANFDDYPVLRMAEAPRIEVHLVPGGGPVGGVGEPGVPPVAPAVANALFAATGIRVRSLPLAPQTVLKARKG